MSETEMFNKLSKDMHLDYNMSKLLLSIIEETKYRNEYKEDLAKNKIMNKNDAERYTRGYNDGIIFALKKIFPNHDIDWESLVDKAIELYDDSCELEVPLLSKKFILKYQESYGIVIDSKSYKNRNGKIKTTITAVCSAPNTNFVNQDALYMVKIDDYNYICFDIDKIVVLNIYDDELDNVAVVSEVSDSVMENLLRFRKSYVEKSEHKYDNLPQ